MENLKSFFDWFSLMSPTKKNSFLMVLIIVALVFVINYQNRDFKEKYQILYNDYNILVFRCDSISNINQKSINEVLQKYSDKFENLFKENQKIKK
jgi:hypothetical protein